MPVRYCCNKFKCLKAVKNVLRFFLYISINKKSAVTYADILV